MFRKILFRFCCALSLGAGSVFAAYIEGTDTTDVNGNGLNSAFSIINNNVSGQNIVRYHMDGTSTGYFNYSFADIKMAPDSNRSAANVTGLHCFVIKNNLTAIYSKVQVLKQLPDNRYVFKYGTNITPNDRMFEQPNYNRSIRYKPNNFCNSFQYYCMPGFNICQKNISLWDPPLPNDNHLLGYIYYRSKIGATIDTTAPINIAQWDSIAFITSTSFEFGGQPSQYFNLVAVYSEGKSDFLLGWSKRVLQVVGVEPNSKETGKFLDDITIKKTSGGFLIAFPSFQNINGSPSLGIYSVTGKRTAWFSDLTTNKVYWKTKDQTLANGPYVIKLESADKTVFTRMLVLSRD